MPEAKLHFSTRTDEAEWLRPRLRRLYTVDSIVPGGFPAYVRILHPSRGPGDRLSTWADVATRSGRTMHRLVQFHAIEQPRSSLSTVDRQSRSYGEIVNGLVHPPDTGTLEPARLTALCEVLAQHTNTKDSCFFCIWEGHGWLPDMRTSQLPDVLENLPKIDLPLRRYYLFEGPLHAASQFCWTLTETCFVPASPNLFWPADHAWCVASEIDLYCTLIAGSEALAEALLADARLETWRVYPGDSVTYDSDRINTD